MVLGTGSGHKFLGGRVSNWVWQQQKFTPFCFSIRFVNKVTPEISDASMQWRCLNKENLGSWTSNWVSNPRSTTMWIQKEIFHSWLLECCVKVFKWSNQETPNTSPGWRDMLTENKMIYLVIKPYFLVHDGLLESHERVRLFLNKIHCIYKGALLKSRLLSWPQL